MESIEAVRDAATRVMARAVGEVRLGTATSLTGSDRSTVLRLMVENASDGAPSSIVVKRAIGLGTEEDDPTRPDSPSIRYANEWASLQFLQDVAADEPFAPRLYGADRDAGILVMEDLGHMPLQSDILLGDDPDAARADLIAYATTVGRMHARTAPHVAEFKRLRNSLGPPNPGFGWEWIVPTFHGMLDCLGIPPVDGLDDDLATLAACMADPGDFAAFIHADPCPDNGGRIGDRGYLIDFEFSHIGHALMDGVYGRVPFPTCWCVGMIPEDVAGEMDRAYRQELSRGCPAALNDQRYARAVAEACVFWMILLCHWHPLPNLIEEDREWGPGTIRQRLLVRLAVAAGVTADADHLTAIGEMAGVMAGVLHERWDADVAPMPLYPAFQAT
ncbi:MAG TPA: phosphotransferase [Thermomicrobiales bacterium]|nr:phosphotransferase [Thermomicrobiales bacterium]